MNFILNEKVKVVGRVVIVRYDININGENYVLESHAICSPEDTFNEEMGIEVARAKNRTKIVKALKKVYAKIVAEKQAKCDELTRKIEKLERAKDRLENAMVDDEVDADYIFDNFDFIMKNLFGC